jgi:hypothetical protein
MNYIHNKIENKRITMQRIKMEVKTARQIVENIILVLSTSILLPLTILDVVYACSRDPCLWMYPTNMNIHLKKYLLVSACLEAMIMIFFMYEIILYYSNRKTSIEYLVFSIAFQLLTNLFQLLWNSIGCILFWGYLYNKCNTSISDYLWVSFILKFILNYIIMMSIKKE